MSDASGSEPQAPSIEELLAHTRWVEALARRLVHDAAEAEDVTQAAWVVALRHRDTPKTNVRAWLASVVRGLARERHRRESQRAAIELRGARHEALPSTDELASRAEAERDVVAAVLALDEVDRRTLLLRYFEGLRPEEIARREGVAPQTVHNRVSRAHARLRERLNRAGHGEWLAAIAPILAPRASSVSFPVSHSPWILMSTTTKVVGSVALLALALFLWSLSRGDAPRPGALDVAASTTASTDALAAPARVDADRKPAAATSEATVPSSNDASASKATPTPDTPRASSTGGRIHGTVYRSDGEVAARRRVRMVFCPDGTQKGEKEIAVVTDELGRFARDGLRRGVWAVSTWPSTDELELLGYAGVNTLGGMAFLRERSVDVDVDSDIELVLGKPSRTRVTITGSVRRAGVEVASPILQWFPPGEDSISREFVSLSRAAGTYEVTVDEPGTYLVTVAGQSGHPHADFVVTVPTGPTLRHDVDLPANVVRGTVVGANGDPVAGAIVELTPRRLATLPSHLFLLMQPQTTDAKGEFTFIGLPDGRFDVSVTRSETSPEVAGALVARLDVPSAPQDRCEPVTLVARVGQAVPVRVLGVDGLESSSLVFVFDANGEPLNAMSGRGRGKGSPFVLPPGRYSFVAGRYFEWSQPRDVEVVEGRPNETVDLRLEPTARLEVSMPGFENAWIDVRDEAGRRMTILCDGAGTNRAVQRDWSPDARVWRLPAGNYTVEARSLAGAKLASATTAILSGERKTVVLKR